MVRFVGAAYSPVTPTVRFVGTAQSPAAPTNVHYINGYSPLLPPRVAHSYKKRLGGLRHLPKIALLRWKEFGLKSLGGEVVKGKKMLFHIFFKF